MTLRCPEYSRPSWRCLRVRHPVRFEFRPMSSTRSSCLIHLSLMPSMTAILLDATAPVDCTSPLGNPAGHLQTFAEVESKFDIAYFLQGTFLRRSCNSCNTPNTSQRGTKPSCTGATMNTPPTGVCGTAAGKVASHIMVMRGAGSVCLWTQPNYHQSSLSSRNNEIRRVSWTASPCFGRTALLGTCVSDGLTIRHLSSWKTRQRSSTAFS